MGLRRGVRRAGRAVLRVPVRVVVAGEGRGRRARAGARARPAHLEPRRHPALGRHDDLDGAAARAPAPALPALPRPRLGVRPTVGLLGDPQGRRRRGVAVQRAAPARAGPAGGGLPRGREGHGQALLRALPAPALRARRVRGDRAAHRRADRAGGRGRERGDLPEDRRHPAGRARARRALLPGHAHVPVARPAGHRAAAVEVADRVPGADRDGVLRPGGRRRPRSGAGAVREGPRARSSRPSTRTSYAGVLPLYKRSIWPIFEPDAHPGRPASSAGAANRARNGHGRSR